MSLTPSAILAIILPIPVHDFTTLVNGVSIPKKSPSIPLENMVGFSLYISKIVPPIIVTIVLMFSAASVKSASVKFLLPIIFPPSPYIGIERLA